MAAERVIASTDGKTPPFTYWHRLFHGNNMIELQGTLARPCKNLDCKKTTAVGKWFRLKSLDDWAAVRW